APALKPIYEAVAWFTELPHQEISALFRDHPPHLLAFFAAGLWCVPGLAYITGFDQTATDIRSRHLRFLLLRVDRATLFAGRAVATLVVLSLSYLLAIALLAWLMTGVEGGVGGVAGFGYLARIWLSLVLFTIPFVALLAWTNTLTGHPYMALAVAVALQFGLWVTGLVGGWMDVPTVEMAQQLFPTAHKYKLLSDDFGLLRTALLHQLGLAAAFAALGWRSFRRRDV
ncbi:MAG: hypothetical protein QF464_19390, partial [Myxococcota bacterium]|nr:hypothetical protein [Myxococcota bacterium]